MCRVCVCACVYKRLTFEAEAHADDLEHHLDGEGNREHQLGLLSKLQWRCVRGPEDELEHVGWLKAAKREGTVREGRRQAAYGQLRIKFATFTDHHTFYQSTGSHNVAIDASDRLFFEATNI